MVSGNCTGQLFQRYILYADISGRTGQVVILKNCITKSRLEILWGECYMR